MMGEPQPSAANQGHAINIDKQRLGSVYARALLGATEANQQSESVMEELDTLVDRVLQGHPALEATLASPRVSPGDKAALLDHIFEGRISEQLLTFLKVVAMHGRLDCIRQIRRAAREEINRLRSRVGVQVTTAEPLNHDLRARIEQQLQSKLGRQIDLQCIVDSRVLGGLLVRVGDTVFDASVANRLARLKVEIINNTSLALRESIDRFAISGRISY
jgi:F-type H+-transporting ATPase subunit delta